jgi:hypothetical protein
MAELTFANRAELIDLMVDTLNRLGSVVVKDRCASWIKLHEARANRVLRDRNMVLRATASLVNGMIRLPNDFKEAIQIQINDGTLVKPRPLSLVTQEEADRIRASGRLTEPAHYAIVGNYLEVVPYTDTASAIELAYYKAVPALTTEAPTNWLLTEHPDYYFYGALVHSAPYLRDDERIVIWGQLAQTAQDEMLIATERSRLSGSRLKTRARLRN